MRYKYITLFLLTLTPAFLFGSQPVFTTDWFSHNIKDWNKYKAQFYKKPNQYCLEIGSWEGRSSLYIIKNYCNGKGSHLVCIDTWEGSKEHSEGESKSLYERFLYNTKEYTKNDKIIPKRGTSKEKLLDLNQQLKAGAIQKYSFIYIDGSHDAKDVLLDAVLAWELLKIGGIMIFDDYGWGGDSGYNGYQTPKPAIDGFLSAYQSMYEIIKHEYQLHIRKISDVPAAKGK